MLLLKLVISLAFFYYALAKVEIGSVISVLEGVEIQYLLFAMLAQFASTSVSGLRSNFYHRGYGITMPLSESFLLYWLGNFYNLVLPGGVGGDVLKALKISKNYVCKKSLALRIQLYERVNGFYPLVLITLVFVLLNNVNGYLELKYCAIFLLVATTPAYLFGVRYVLRDNLRVATAAAWRYSLATQVLHVLSALMLCLAFQKSLPSSFYIEFITIYLVGTIATILPISAGGVGVKEFCFISLLPFLSGANYLDVGLGYAFVAYLLSLAVGLIGGALWLVFKVRGL